MQKDMKCCICKQDLETIYCTKFLGSVYTPSFRCEAPLRCPSCTQASRSHRREHVIQFETPICHSCSMLESKRAAGEHMVYNDLLDAWVDDEGLAQQLSRLTSLHCPTCTAEKGEESSPTFK